MVTQQSRLSAAVRRFKFEFAKQIGIFWLISKVPFLEIKSPWDKLYQRSSLKNKTKHENKGI